MADEIKARAIKVCQPIGEFYICSIAASDLFEIAKAEIRRPHGRKIEEYVGIQRDLNLTRVGEIKKYVKLVDACFPTSVILAVSSDDITFDSNRSELTIRRDQNVAKVIDGQHRIAGFEEYLGDDFFLNATIFIDMEMEDQAMVFATINLKQTKVSKSLAYDLYEYTVKRSPQKTCHNIAKLLNSKDGSPLKGRIKILGKAESPEGTITQATFVDRLLKYISKDPMKDRDDLKRGKLLEAGPESLIFRERFMSEKDAEIAKVLWNFFTAVSKRWPKAWIDFERGAVLSRTNGFAALMRCLPFFGDFGEIPSVEKFLKRLENVDLKDSEINTTTFPPGSTGEGLLFRALESGLLK